MASAIPKCLSIYIKYYSPVILQIQLNTQNITENLKPQNMLNGWELPIIWSYSTVYQKTLKEI